MSRTLRNHENWKRQQTEEETHLRIMREPTMTRAPPVAHGGMEAKIGAKKTETKKANPVTQAVIPVLPPSEGQTTV
jgi:hypothetical protein